MESPKGKWTCTKHPKPFAIITASVVFSLFLGCGSSPYIYTLSTLTPSSVVAGTGDFMQTLNNITAGIGDIGCLSQTTQSLQAERSIK